MSFFPGEAGVPGLARTFVTHLRPASWPVVFLHFSAGWGVAAAHGGWVASPAEGATLGVFWTVFLNGGTLGLNSAIDRDSGAIGYLQRPPPVQPGQAVLCVAWMLAGGVGSALLSLPVGATYGVCILLSVAYSVPPVRLKARPGFDLGVNMLGYGALTFLAGVLAAGEGRPGFWVLALGFAFLFAALYPLTQLYQIDADRAAGVRTLAIMLGRRRSLDVATGAALLAHALFAAGFLMAGFHAGQVTWLLLPAGLWMALLGGWRAGRVRDEKAAMYWGTRLYGFADVVVVGIAVLG
ncbi:MAG: UbiA family prenyltransferase [Planctomycetota bacterium]